METLGRTKPLIRAAMPLLRKGYCRPKRALPPPICQPGFFTKLATAVRERGIIPESRPRPDRVWHVRSLLGSWVGRIAVVLPDRAALVSHFVERRSPESLQRRALENVTRLLDYHREAVARWTQLASPARTVGIVGAGSMGTYLAAIEVQHGIPTTVTDGDRRVLCRLNERVADELSHEIPQESAQERVDHLLMTSISLGPVLRSDLVIESIVESIAAKQKLYAEIEPQLAPDAVLMTNTGTMSVGRLAAALREPARFCGMRFCQPLRQRPLVEIVRGTKTSDRTLSVAVQHAAALQRMPVIVPDGPGFLVTRLMLPYLCAGADLLSVGASPSAVEEAALRFGMAMGPLRLIDEIGLDRLLQYGGQVSPMLGDEEPVYRLLVEMVKHGRTGRAAGAGFYDYPADPADQPVVSRAASEMISAAVDAQENLNDHALTMSLVLPMLVEAARMIEEHRVSDPRDIDLGMIYGLGFPPTKGGLLWWADNLGAARITEMLRPLPRFVARLEPPPLLHRLARSGGRFYGSL